MPFQITDLVGFVYTFISYRQQEEANNLLRQMVSYQKESLTEIQSVQQEIRALIEGPFHSAFILLEDASKPHRDIGERENLVRQARTNFVQVLGVLEASEFSTENEDKKAMIQIHISLCWLILESKQDAIEWIDKAKTVLYYNGYRKHPITKQISRIDVTIDELNVKIDELDNESLNINNNYKTNKIYNDLVPIFPFGINPFELIGFIFTNGYDEKQVKEYKERELLKEKESRENIIKGKKEFYENELKKLKEKRERLTNELVKTVDLMSSEPLKSLIQLRDTITWM